METVYIGIGANISPAENIVRALTSLAVDVPIAGVSTFYATAPLGRREQPDYFNGVCALTTDIDPMTLQQEVMRRIEADLGRVRSEDRFAARPIDLDLLLWGRRVVSRGGLVLPNPDIRKRAFVAVPLLELDPLLLLPDDLTPLVTVVAGMDSGGMTRLTDYTARVRKVLAL